MKTAEGFVYAMQCGDLIKIGWSRDVGARRKSLKKGGGPELTILFTRPGTMRLERAVLREFRASRVQGNEWFRFTLVEMESLQERFHAVPIPEDLLTPEEVAQIKEEVRVECEMERERDRLADEKEQISMTTYETQARTRKAVALMVAARNAGITAADLATDMSVLRADLVKAVGVNEPSVETWAMVIALLELVESHADADVFAGLS